MTWDIIQEIIKQANQLKPKLVDITGGAPEMNPHLTDFIIELTNHGHPIQVRTNLTVLLEKEMEGLIQIYRDNCVKLVASLPCYEHKRVDHVRGKGTFDDSIKIMKKLNKSGYGVHDKLQLDLVFNPKDAFLPPSQSNLEKTYKLRLKEDFGIVFNHLIKIINMPIGRFKDKLIEENTFARYLNLLQDNFNPNTLDKLMCKTQICVDYDGFLYDCDFNLANKMPLEGKPNIKDTNIKWNDLKKRTIITGLHCFGCTAGEGSSCNGAIIS
jgi:radical SAM/Cys-rich protein